MAPFEADENRPPPPGVVPPVLPPPIGTTYATGPTLNLPRLPSGLPDLTSPIWGGYLIDLLNKNYGLINVGLDGVTNLIAAKIIVVHVTEAGYDVVIDL